MYASEEELEKLSHMTADLCYMQSDVYKLIFEASSKFRKLQ